MIEVHEREQYFFTEETLTALVQQLDGYGKICCLCCPTLGQRLIEIGKSPTILDIDERFSHLSGFQRYDLNHPRWISGSFDLIICDPPFFTVPLSDLKCCISMLSQFNSGQPLIVTYLQRRALKIIHSFDTFGLTMRQGRVRYNTVEDCEKNEIRVFTNILGVSKFLREDPT